MDSSPSTLAIMSPDCTPAFTNSSSVSVFTSQLDLSRNMLCGIDPYTGEGTYTSKGITAIANALKDNTAMKGKSMVNIGMAECYLGVEGAKAMAELVSITSSLTSVR